MKKPIYLCIVYTNLSNSNIIKVSYIKMSENPTQIFKKCAKDYYKLDYIEIQSKDYAIEVGEYINERFTTFIKHFPFEIDTKELQTACYKFIKNKYKKVIQIVKT